MSLRDPTPDFDYMEEGWNDYCSVCDTHTVERHVGVDGLCYYCRNDEAMEHEFDFFEEEEVK